MPILKLCTRPYHDITTLPRFGGGISVGGKLGSLEWEKIMKFIKDYQTLLGFLIVAVMVGYTHLENQKEFRKIDVSDIKRQINDLAVKMKDLEDKKLLDNRLNIMYSQLNTLQSDVTSIKRDVR